MTQHHDGRDEPMQDFPPEAGWLELQPPPLGDDFVGRTLALLKVQGLVRGEPHADRDDDGDLPSELLALYRTPAASRGFVERTVRATQHDRADQWRRLLLRYEAPEPTPDFVARTIAALRAATPMPMRSRARRIAFALLAAAAAAALMFLLRPERPAYALRQLLADTSPSLAMARSPAVLSHLLGGAATARVDARRAISGTIDDGALPLAAADGGWLWLTATEVR